MFVLKCSIGYVVIAGWLVGEVSYQEILLLRPIWRKKYWQNIFNVCQTITFHDQHWKKNIYRNTYVLNTPLYNVCRLLNRKTVVSASCLMFFECKTDSCRARVFLYNVFRVCWSLPGQELKCTDKCSPKQTAYIYSVYMYRLSFYFTTITKQALQIIQIILVCADLRVRALRVGGNNELCNPVSSHTKSTNPKISADENYLYMNAYNHAAYTWYTRM